MGLEWIIQYGPLGLAAACLGFSWQITQYVLKTCREEKASLANLVNGGLKQVAETLILHDKRAEAAIDSMREAQRFQREEHERIIDRIEAIGLR